MYFKVLFDFRALPSSTALKLQRASLKALAGAMRIKSTVDGDSSSCRWNDMQYAELSGLNGHVNSKCTIVNALSEVVPCEDDFHERLV